MPTFKSDSRRIFISTLATGGAGMLLGPTFAKTGLDFFYQPGNNANSEQKTSVQKKFVPVMITPFTSDGKIDFNTLSRLIDFYLSAGVKGFFANCLSSEMYALDEQERLALVSHVAKRINGAVPEVASGSFGQTLAGKADFSKKMMDTGIQAVILITAHFAEKADSDEILIENLGQFLKMTGSMPLGTYECPSPYKRILSPGVFRYLLQTGRLIYHKDTTLDLEQIKVKLDLAKNTPLELYDAHTPNAMYSLQLGATGMSAIAGNFYPEVLAWMCMNATNAAKQEEVKWLQSELTRVDPIISTAYPMSAKYFLQKRKVPVLPVSRTSPSPLKAPQQAALDQVFQDLQHWHDRLGIKKSSA